MYRSPISSGCAITLVKNTSRSSKIFCRQAKTKTWSRLKYGLHFFTKERKYFEKVLGLLTNSPPPRLAHIKLFTSKKYEFVEAPEPIYLGQNPEFLYVQEPLYYRTGVRIFPSPEDIFTNTTSPGRGMYSWISNSERRL